MAAMMGGTMRSPLTAHDFRLELTHRFTPCCRLATACAAAHATTVLLLKRSILTEKWRAAATISSREYSVDPFETVRVADIMAVPVEDALGRHVGARGH